MTAAHPQLIADFNSRNLALASPQNTRLLAPLVDHTFLKPAFATPDIVTLCTEAQVYLFRSVCVPPSAVELAASILSSHSFSETLLLHDLDTAPADGVLVCTVVGFPLGYQTTATKVFETSKAIEQGAQEIDFVLNASWAKQQHWEQIENEARTIVEAAKGKLVKVILETSLLTSEEIDECSFRLAVAGVPVVKTSTGFGSRGASAEDISIIKKALDRATAATGLSYGIKASGGIRNAADALLLCTLGATRIGTSNGIAIVEHGNAGANPNSY